MSRLTQRNEANTNYYYPLCFEKCHGEGSSGECDSCRLTDLICEKLGQYEDAEEQGLLLRLMCDAGDKVYYTCFIDSRVIDFEIVEIKIYEDEIIYIDDSDNEWHEYDLGKAIFLTKEEAEKKLASMKGESNG